MEKNSLSNIRVRKAMRRHFHRLTMSSSISNCIKALMKYKVNGILTTDDDSAPAGVISKTDIMGAYYAGISLDTAVETVMSSPPMFCSGDDFLEDALDKMKEYGVYRLFVTSEDPADVIGVLAYPDIVGLLYKYCHDCDYSHVKRKEDWRYRTYDYISVDDLMTPEVISILETDTIYNGIELLSAFRLGALLVCDEEGFPKGVISKTDIVAAYMRSFDPALPVQQIMTQPVKSCSAGDLLEDGIKAMIFQDIHRLFVHGKNPDEIIGVFSLSDAARSRSGSCHACISSRIRLVA